MPLEILPAVLAHDERDFSARLLHPELKRRAKMFHVDILDGTLFHTSCWAEPNIIGSWPDLPDIELHAMVYHPLRLARAWEHIPTFKRIIVHIELGDHLRIVVPQLKERGLEVVAAVNPRTAVDVVGDLDLAFDGILIMGVEPGKSGQTFLGEPILAKMRRAKTLFPNLPLAVDGGVRANLVGSLVQAGASRLVAASALWQAENPGEAFDVLVAHAS